MERVWCLDRTLAAAVRTWVSNNIALSIALPACLADTEKTLLVADLSSTTAGRTNLRFRARLGARAIAGPANAGEGDFYLLLYAEGGLFKSDFQIIQQIVAASSLERLSPPPRLRRRYHQRCRQRCRQTVCRHQNLESAEKPPAPDTPACPNWSYCDLFWASERIS